MKRIQKEVIEDDDDGGGDDVMQWKRMEQWMSQERRLN